MITRISEIISNWMGWCPNAQMLPNAPVRATITPAPGLDDPTGGDDGGSQYEYGRQRHGKHFLVPAGLLMGLGVGMVIGYPWPGMLIGMGLGFLGSMFVNPMQRASGIVPAHELFRRWEFALLGIFFIVFGFSIGWAPVTRLYIAAFFLILLGIGFFIRGFVKRY